MECAKLIERAMEIRQQYADLEAARYGRPWGLEELALGFMGDVGDLAKLLIAHRGVRSIPDAEQKLAHELADCLWSILVLSQQVGIDLENAFLRTMDDLEQQIAAQRHP
jgi:NTP pyrophosphatase (non-canonical NTP hydrolase)